MAIPRRTASGQNVAQVSETAPYAVMTTDSPSRTLFRGSEESARNYILNHHPRLHVNPGDDWGQDGPMPDAVFTHPDGSEEYWNGERWIADADLPSEPVEKADAPEADIPAGSKASWNGTEWVLVPDDGVAEDTGVVTDATEIPV